MDIKILEQYLRDDLAIGIANFVLQARLTKDGNLALQIQPCSFEWLNLPIEEDEIPELIAQDHKTTPSLHDYLLKNWEKSHIDHTLRVERHSEGIHCYIHPASVVGVAVESLALRTSEEGIHGYIHPAAVDGYDTLDFIISPDDQVRQVPAAESEAPTQGLE